FAIQAYGAIDLTGSRISAGGGPFVIEFVEIKDGGVVMEPTGCQDISRGPEIMEQLAVDEGGAPVIACTGCGLGGLAVLLGQVRLQILTAKPVTGPTSSPQQVTERIQQVVDGQARIAGGHAASQAFVSAQGECAA